MGFLCAIITCQINLSPSHLSVPIGNSPGDGIDHRYNATALEEYNQEERNQKTII